MKKLVMVIVLWFSGASWAWAEESPCRDKLLKICQTNAEGNAICQILKQDAMETPESIVAFLKAIGSLEDGQRELMICARLVGRKRLKLGFISDDQKELFGGVHYGSDEDPWSSKQYFYIHAMDGLVRRYLTFMFQETTPIIDQWLTIRKMEPFNNTLTIIMTVDVSEVTTDSRKGLFTVVIQKIISVDNESTRLIQQHMNRVLKIGLE